MYIVSKNFGTRVEKIDKTTVKFIFERPYTSLLFYLAGNGSYHDPFAPKHFLARYHIKYNPDADKQAKANGFENWAAQFRIYWNRWKDGVVNKASGLKVPTLESHILKEAPTPQGRIFIANPYYFKIDTAGNQLPYINFHHERFLEKELWAREIIEGRVDQKSQNMSIDIYPILEKNRQKGNYSLQMPITGLGPAILFNKTHKDPVKKKSMLIPNSIMPPFGVGYPVTNIAWWQWKNSNGKLGEEPPLWVKNLWEIGDAFVSLVPGSDWYNALGKEIIRINLENLSVIGTLAEVPLITVVTKRLGNIPQWKINSYYYGYAYPYRADQWYFK